LRAVKAVLSMACTVSKGVQQVLRRVSKGQSTLLEAKRSIQMAEAIGLLPAKSAR
jgi:hypothetical protein